MIIDLGLIDYEQAYKTQKEFVRLRKLGEITDTFIICEHLPVFTIGRTGNIANLLVDDRTLKRSGARVLRIDRGGDITFHGPGQLVIYPIMDLRQYGRDLHRYLRALEESAVSFFRGYSVLANRMEGKTGVWFEGKKAASIGIAASDWVTYHGLAININTDLRFFSMIHPCGLRGVETVSLEGILGREVDMADAKDRILSAIGAVFRTGDKTIGKKDHALVA